MGGNPRREQQSEQEVVSRSETVRQSRSLRAEKRNPNGNIFSGFNTNMLAQSFNIDNELARKIQSQDDRRERIVRVMGDDLRVLTPARIREEEQSERSKYGYGYEGGYNGIEETFCSLKLRYNIDRPSHADIFNPRGGRITTASSFNLPILRHIQLTAERGVLYKVRNKYCGGCCCFFFFILILQQLGT